MKKIFTVLPIPDEVNVNGRYYSKEVLESAINVYMEKIKDGKADVMLGIPRLDESLEYFTIPTDKIIGTLTDMEFTDEKYLATVNFDRPTKEIGDILEQEYLAVGLNKTGNVDKNGKVTNVNIISASIIPDSRKAIKDMVDMDDLTYFMNKFKTAPYDHRSRNQLVTIIDAIYSNEKIKRALENVKEKD